MEAIDNCAVKTLAKNPFFINKEDTNNNETVETFPSKSSTDSTPNVVADNHSQSPVSMSINARSGTNNVTSGSSAKANISFEPKGNPLTWSAGHQASHSTNTTSTTDTNNSHNKSNHNNNSPKHIKAGKKRLKNNKIRSRETIKLASGLANQLFNARSSGTWSITTGLLENNQNLQHSGNSNANQQTSYISPTTSLNSETPFRIKDEAIDISSESSTVSILSNLDSDIQTDKEKGKSIMKATYNSSPAWNLGNREIIQIEDDDEEEEEDEKEKEEEINNGFRPRHVNIEGTELELYIRLYLQNMSSVTFGYSCLSIRFLRLIKLAIKNDRLQDEDLNDEINSIFDDLYDYPDLLHGFEEIIRKIDTNPDTGSDMVSMIKNLMVFINEAVREETGGLDKMDTSDLLSRKRFNFLNAIKDKPPKIKKKFNGKKFSNTTPRRRSGRRERAKSSGSINPSHPVRKSRRIIAGHTHPLYGE